VGKALEHDVIRLYLLEPLDPGVEADPPLTELVNAAIDLFAIVLPLQPSKVQESSLEQLAVLLSRPHSREPGRRSALRINVATAILNAMVVASRETRFSPGKLATSTIEKIARDIIQVRLLEFHFRVY
jgi:HEAT repeat-containing protein 5